MLKRKRGTYDSKKVDPERAAQLKKEGVEWTIFNARKDLTKALKAAKGFERQKLGKRRRIATEEQDDAKCQQRMTEIEALKSLDLSILADSYLRKSLSKSKSISQSAFMPETLKDDSWKKNTALPDSLAISNVRARLYNTKPVKQAMSQIMDSFYSILEIPKPIAAPKTKTTSDLVSPKQDGDDQKRPVSQSDGAKQPVDGETHRTEDHMVHAVKETNDPESEFKSHPGNVSRHDLKIKHSADEDVRDNEREPKPLIEHSADQKILGNEGEFKSLMEDSAEENILENEGAAKSLVEDSAEEKIIKIEDEFKPLVERSPSISPSDGSQSPSPQRHHKKSRKRAPPLKSESTFLPTLMGGYWSGSESATDEDAPAPRKNRPGQQARRAMWEKMYGTNANHLKGPASNKLKDKDWDVKRGARSYDREGRRGGGTFTHRGNFGKGMESGVNAMAVKPRPRGMGKKDDAGPLHPSWEAAKKAKEAKQTAKFQGKKVVFD